TATPTPKPAATPTPKPTATPTPKPTATPTPKPVVILYNTFDTQALNAAPTGWSLVKTGGTVTISGVPSVTDKSIKLNKTKTTALSATRTFTPQRGRVDVKAELRSEKVTGCKSYLNILNSSGKALVRI